MRGLIGFASELKNDTKGTGILNHTFFGYTPFMGPIESSRKGCMISMASGVTTGYALADLESRGQLFLAPGNKVYPGMVIGECSRVLDMEVNPCRAKAVTNVRSTVKEEFFRLSPPKSMPLEEMISYMAEDEMLEVTPTSLRLRKWDLDPNARKRRAQSKRALSHN
jgi:GTP-binding protein